MYLLLYYQHVSTSRCCPSNSMELPLLPRPAMDGSSDAEGVRMAHLPADLVDVLVTLICELGALVHGPAGQLHSLCRGT